MKKWMVASLFALQAATGAPGFAQTSYTPSDEPPADPTVALDPNRDTSAMSSAAGDIGSIGSGAIRGISVQMDSIRNGQPIPLQYAYCIPDGKGQTRPGRNISPAIHWFGAPPDTKSYALIMVDSDVPADLGLINKPTKGIPENAPRQNFYHWVLVDIPASVVSIAEGADSKGITDGGKAAGKMEYGVDGQNDYAAKAHMGKGGGYDGPCPPWNDFRLHHYHFDVYALNVPSLNLFGNFTGEQAISAMRGHVLAKGEVIGTFTNNTRAGAP